MKSQESKIAGNVIEYHHIFAIFEILIQITESESDTEKAATY